MARFEDGVVPFHCTTMRSRTYLFTVLYIAIRYIVADFGEHFLFYLPSVTSQIAGHSETLDVKHSRDSIKVPLIFFLCAISLRERLICRILYDVS